jgi:hypothetical protein
VVHRSWGLLRQLADSDQQFAKVVYGPRFSFESTMRFSSRKEKLTFAAWYYAAVLLLSAFSCVRRRALAAHSPGSGPTPRDRDDNCFEYRAIAVPDFAAIAAPTLDASSGSSGNANGNGTAVKSAKGIALASLRFEGDIYSFTALALVEAATLLGESPPAPDFAASPASRIRGIVTPSMLGGQFQSRLAACGVKIATATGDLSGLTPTSKGEGVVVADATAANTVATATHEADRRAARARVQGGASIGVDAAAALDAVGSTSKADSADAASVSSPDGPIDPQPLRPPGRHQSPTYEIWCPEVAAAHGQEDGA